MNQDETDALIGQASADALLLFAITRILIARVPGAAADLEQQVEAEALSHRMKLMHPPVRAAFSGRLQELRALWRDEPAG